MRKTAPVLATSTDLTISQFERLSEGWIADGEIERLSPRTLQERRHVIGKLRWHLARQQAESVGLPELRQFFVYLNDPSPAGGRWGNPRNTCALSAVTVLAYHRTLRSFWNSLVDLDEIDASPMRRMKPPRIPDDQVQPFADEQVEAMLAAAARSTHPRRDTAILLLLLDTGIRASELCALRFRDYQVTQRLVTVEEGKGKKRRALPLGANTTRALLHYLREHEREQDAPLFVSDRGVTAGEHLTRSGLGQLIRRLGRAARVQGVRCSPHTWRHTFAINFLRSGGDVFTLKELLGHTTLVMTNRYVALARADIQRQHRAHSPADRIKKRAA